VLKVFVAEDEALVRGGLCALLELEPDMELAGEAADGAAAVEGVLRSHPDVVLMDVQMPVLDGIEATRRILGAGSRARIVMVTTFDQDEYVYKALRAGASGFLLKALAPERLAAAVRTIAGGESVLDPTLTRRLIEEYLVRPEPDERLARRLEDLTDREREVWLLLAQGKSNAEMGQDLFLSDATIKSHVTRLLSKLGVRSRVGAVVLAYESGLIRPGGLREA
jgi:DNA-binding NarL/FixJ family response regulator